MQFSRETPSFRRAGNLHRHEVLRDFKRVTRTHFDEPSSSWPLEKTRLGDWAKSFLDIPIKTKRVHLYICTLLNFCSRSRQFPWPRYPGFRGFLITRREGPIFAGCGLENLRDQGTAKKTKNHETITKLSTRFLKIPKRTHETVRGLK